MDNNNENRDQNRPSDMANSGRGQQGIDKAPGEEPSATTENVVADTQKGKNKVDGDPTQESDQPINNE